MCVECVKKKNSPKPPSADRIFKPKAEEPAEAPAPKGSEEGGK